MVGALQHGELSRIDAKSDAIVPFLSGIPAERSATLTTVSESKVEDCIYYLHETDQPSVMAGRVRDQEPERGSRFKELPASRLFRFLARPGSRRFTPSAPPHGHPEAGLH